MRPLIASSIIFSINPYGFGGTSIKNFSFETKKKNHVCTSCVLQSLISHVSLLCYTQARPQSSKIPVWIFHKPCLCVLFMSCLNTQRPIASMSSLAYLLDIRRVQAELQQKEEEGRGRNERSPSLQEPDINQTNYGATTVSNPWRGNETIRVRSQLNREGVNENINYLMIYWGSGAPHPTLSLLRSQTPYHREHLF